MAKTATIAQMKKWVADWKRWYEKTYHIEYNLDTPYDAMNRQAEKVIVDIFDHMIDDLENDKKFADTSKEYFTNMIKYD